MLSPGRWHEEVSRDPKRNVEQRVAVLRAAVGNPALQKLIVERCRDDILFYVNLFCWQHDPSKGGAAATAPFVTFPRQEELLLARPETHRHLAPFDKGVLWCYEHDKTMACEKSRWQGASWLFLIFLDWLCGFHSHRDVLCVSRNENAVDDGTKKSLFWKVRYMHSLQPLWLRGEIESSKLYFHYKRTNSEITGEASTAKAGVGGRASVIFVDEFPEIEKGQEVREKTALTANSRFFVGTHLGSGTPFADLCDRRKSPEIVQQRLHWTDGLPEQKAGLYEFDPTRPGIPKILDTGYPFPPDYPFVLDGTPTGGHRPGVRSPWYDRKAAEMGDARATAQNLDIDQHGAAKQFFDGLKIRNLIAATARPPVWVGDLIYEPHTGRFQKLAPSAAGRLKLWVHPTGDGRLPQSRYTVGVDVAAGTGATNSCAAGIDADRSLKVLEYANPFLPEPEFAKVVYAIVQLLAGAGNREAYLVWDASGQQGTKFEQAILALGASNVYHNEDDVYRGPKTPAVRRPGWFGKTAQKYAMLVDYRQALYEYVLTDRSEECLSETLLFEYDRRTNEVKHAGEMRTNDPSGARKNHGDMVTATGLAWMLAKDFAEGGRRHRKADPGPPAGSLDWLLLLDRARRRELEEV